MSNLKAVKVNAQNSLSKVEICFLSSLSGKCFIEASSREIATDVWYPDVLNKLNFLCFVPSFLVSFRDGYISDCTLVNISRMYLKN